MIHIVGSSNGRTTDFDSVNLGSSPSPTANFVKFAFSARARTGKRRGELPLPQFSRAQATTKTPFY